MDNSCIECGRSIGDGLLCNPCKWKGQADDETKLADYMRLKEPWRYE